MVVNGMHKHAMDIAKGGWITLSCSKAVININWVQGVLVGQAQLVEW